MSEYRVSAENVKAGGASPEVAIDKIPVWSWRNAIAKTKAPTLTKALCWAIANYLNDAGKGCWPSIETLMSDTGMSDRSITNHLKIAAEADLLLPRRKRLPNGTLGAYMFHPKFPKTVRLVEDGDIASDGGVEPPAPNAPGPNPPASDDTPPARGAALVKNISTKNISTNTPPTPSQARGDRAQCLEAFNLWNEAALRLGLRQATKMTPDRERKLRARLRDYSLDDWKQALANIDRSRFLRGLEGKWRGCYFDFLISPSGFSKVFDGVFDDAKSALAKAAGVDPSETVTLRAGTAEFARAVADVRRASPSTAEDWERRGYCVLHKTDRLAAPAQLMEPAHV